MTKCALTCYNVNLTFLVDHFFNSGQKTNFYNCLVKLFCLSSPFLPYVLVKAPTDGFTDLTPFSALILMQKHN
jgi:hypothetical protein